MEKTLRDEKKCKRCLGKGWGSVLQRITWGVDFSDDHGEETRIGRIFCHYCLKGKRMQMRARKANWEPFAFRPEGIVWVENNLKKN